MRPLLALLTLAAFTSAAPVPKGAKAKDDAALIVGTWKPTDKGTCHYQFRDDGTMKTWHTPNVGPPIEWTFTLDPTTTPKSMKLTRTNEKTVYNCVYSLDGDRLKLAFVLGVKGELGEKWEQTPGLQLYDQTRDTGK